MSSQNNFILVDNKLLQISSNKIGTFNYSEGLANKCQYLANICCKQQQLQLEKASAHKSAKTHAGNVFATRDLDLFTAK